jgi:plastocyanin
MSTHVRATALLIAALVLGAVSNTAMAQTTATLTVAAAGFSPAQISVTANTAVQLTIANGSSHTVELEGPPLPKIVVLSPGGTSGPLVIGPLPPGIYTVRDDLHPNAVPATIVAQ